MKYKNLFLILFALGVLKVLAIFYTSFDLFGDEAQYWIWSKNLETGYYSKPPLLPWIISIFTLFFGSSFEALKLIPFIFYIFTSYIIFILTLEIYNNKNLAIITALSFNIIPAVTISSFIISTDVILIFFWSLSLFFLLKIRTKPQLINFLMLGIFLGMSFLAKYAASYFLISTLAIMILDKKTRVSFSKNLLGSLIFIFTTVIVVMPNIVWNIKNDWVTFEHTSENAGLSRANVNLFQGIEFIFSQALMLGPILFVFFIFIYKKIKIDFNTKFLLSFSLPIFFIVFLESIIVRANANWAAVAIVPFFILMVKHAYIYSKNILFFSNGLNILICIFFFTLVLFSYPLVIFDRINGISKFADKLNTELIVDKKYLVVQDRLLYSSLRYHFRKSSLIIYTPHNPKNKIKSHFHLSDPLPEVFDQNFLYIGDTNEIGYLKRKNNITKIKSIDVVFKKNTINIYEVIF